MAKTKVLITVKTYPAISSKYDELVCTAGFLEDGRWIRIYPIQFRKKSFEEQYKKYDWIEIDLVKNTSDFNKEIMTSLAIFKPTEIIDFTAEPVEREWDKKKLEKLKQERSNLFAQEEEDLFEVVKKLPYKFSYILKDCNGRQSKMMIEDWEIGQLYWNCLSQQEGNEMEAIKKVKSKYFDDFAKSKDLYLFLGTSQVHHFTGRNPFMIIGTFHPKIESQLRLF